MDSASRN